MSPPYLDPGGIEACSRWLSEATPPDDGMPAKLVEPIVKTGLAPLPGCGIRGDWVPVVSLVPHSTTGYRMGCLRHRQSRLPHLDPSGIGACSRWLNPRQRVTPPDHRIKHNPHPGGMPSRAVCSIEVTRIVGSSGFLQELDQLLAEGFQPMVFLLIGNVGAN